MKELQPYFDIIGRHLEESRKLPGRDFANSDPETGAPLYIARMLRELHVVVCKRSPNVLLEDLVMAEIRNSGASDYHRGLALSCLALSEGETV